MASSEALQAAKVYRHLLKSLKKHIGTEEHKVHFKEFIKQEFQKSRQQIDPSLIQHKVKLARDFTIFLNSVHHHKDLLFSYNIAVDRTDEMKKVLGKSAASVGLQLPKFTNLRSMVDSPTLLQALDLKVIDLGANGIELEAKKSNVREHNESVDGTLPQWPAAGFIKHHPDPTPDKFVARHQSSPL